MGNSPSTITPHDRAVLDLKVQRDRLEDYRTKIELVMEREKQVAKHHLLRGDKDRALLALKKKSFQASLIQKTHAQLEQINGMINSVEFSMLQRGVYESLKKGSVALDTLNKEMPLEDVERLMDETADGIAYQKEVEEMLHGIVTSDMIDDAEEELAALIAEEEAASIPPAKDTPLYLPSPPTTLPAQLPEVLSHPLREAQEVEASIPA